MVQGCEVCTILSEQSPTDEAVILQSSYWRVVLDANQQFLGKMFVTLIDHKETLSDVTADEWLDLHDVIKKLENAVTVAYQPSHFNWSCLMNIAAMNGGPTHVHWHVHPRYEKPVMVGTEVFEDTQWYPRKERQDHVVAGETLDLIVTKIKDNI